MEDKSDTCKVMFTSDVRWAIMGCSRISQDFCVAMQLCRGHKVVAVASRNIERSKEFSAKFSISKFYGSYEALLRDADIDIVYVGTITSQHYNCAMQVLKAGKALLCEKPLCTSLKQCKQLMKTASEKKVLLVEGLWSMFLPSYKYLKEVLKQMGEVTKVKLEFGSEFDLTSQIHRRECGGGTMLALGCYVIHLLSIVMTSSPVKVKARSDLNDDGLDVKTEIEMEYDGERRVEIKLSLLENCNNTAVIETTGGEIKMKNFWCCEEIEVNGVVFSYPFPPPHQSTNYIKTEGLKYEIEKTGEAWRRGCCEVEEVKHENSMRVFEVLDDVLAQIKVNFECSNE